jgi:hypothetical protein
MSSMQRHCFAARAGSILMLVACGLIAQEPKPELTPEQKLTFQAALTEVYKQLAIGNNLRAQLLQNQDAQRTATAALNAACPGEVIGLEKDAAECKPKAPEAPKAGDPAPAAKTKEGSK